MRLVKQLHNNHCFGSFNQSWKKNLTVKNIRTNNSSTYSRLGKIDIFHGQIFSSERLTHFRNFGATKNVSIFPRRLYQNPDRSFFLKNLSTRSLIVRFLINSSSWGTPSLFLSQKASRIALPFPLKTSSWSGFSGPTHRRSTGSGSVLIFVTRSSIGTFTPSGPSQGSADELNHSTGSNIKWMVHEG